MKGLKKDRFLLYASLAGFGLGAFSFLLMAPATVEGILDVLAGCCFWLGFGVGIGCMMRLNVRRKKWEARTGKSCGTDRPGLISFFRNKPGKYADIALCAGAAGLAVCLALGRYAGVLSFVFLSVTVFSLAAHCIFNGKNYSYVSIRERKMPESLDPAKEDEK